MHLKHWQKWAYYSQWTIAGGAAAQCFETATRFGFHHINPWFYVLVFSITLLQYMVHFRFYHRRKPLNHRQHFFAGNRKYLVIQFAVTAFLFVTSFIITGFTIIIPLAVMGLFTGAYSFFLLRPPGMGIYKYNGLFKILTITVIWAAVTGVLPVVAAGEDLFAPRYLFHFAMRWLMMLAICLPFDVRDVEVDKRNGTLTIPAIIGVNNTFTVSYLSTIMNILLVMLSVLWGWNTWPVAFANGIANMSLVFSIWYSSRHPREEFSWFLLDANLVIHAVIIAIILLSW